MNINSTSGLMHMTTSRRTVVTAAAALAGSTVLGAPGLAQSDPSEVTFWTSFTGDVEVNALKRIVEAFNASQPDFVTKIVQVPSQSESDVTKLMTAVRGGVGPDVYLFNRPFASQRAADGVLQDLTPFLDGEDLSTTYLDFAFAECKFKDGLYALPFDTDARALYYRKDILTEVGVDPAELDPANGPITLARLDEITALIDKKDSNGKYTRLGFVPWFAQGWHYTWGFNFGGSFYSPDECKITATDAGVVAGFAYMYDRAAALGPAEVQEFLSAVNRPDAPPAENPFYSGSIAFMVSGDWEIANLANYAPDVDYGITYIPVPKAGDEPSSWSAGFSVVMPEGAKNPDGAMAFIRYMAGPDGQRTYVEDTSHLPTVAALLEEDDLFSEEHAFFRDLLQYSTSLPTVPVGALLWDELTAAQDKVKLNEATPEEALAQVEERVQSQLQRYC
jgi:multiple sugar transport system substrate-binding protein